MELIQTLSNIASNAPLGLCLMTDGSEVKLAPEKRIESKDYFDISKVNRPPHYFIYGTCQVQPKQIGISM